MKTTIISQNDAPNFIKEHNQKFYKECSDVLNEKVWPHVKNKVKSADLFQGFFVSDEYGQWKMKFYDENKEIVLEVILDPICGQMGWKY